MTLASLVRVVEVGNTLGECVLWDTRAQKVWWTDIHERLLYRYEPLTGGIERFGLPERLGSFGFVEGSDCIVAAFESGFAFYHPERDETQWIYRPTGSENKRFNDGRVDPSGRFWAGTMVEGAGGADAELFCLNGGMARVRLTGIRIANSLCFSADSRHVYFADSPHGIIDRYDCDPVNGELSNRQLFARTPAGTYPDGSVLDEHGYLWNAQWGGGRIARYAPSGRLAGSIEVPVSQPTCVAFGGPALDLLFITTAREDLSPSALESQPYAGHLFIYQTRVRGVLESRYRR